MIDIVIVNWNGGELFKNCINSIILNDNTNLVKRIIIIDNHSSDDSISALPVNEKILVIQNAENFGFSRACNQGFKLCNSPYILLLNPDTRLFESTLQDCLDFMNNRADVDILGCQLLEDSGKITKSCARFPTPLRMCFDAIGLSKIAPGIFTPGTLMTDWDHNENRFVNQVMGAFMFIKADIFDKLGFFDERFFVYYEELDFSKRLADSGGLSFYSTEIKAIHIGQGTTRAMRGFSLFLNLRSKLQYAKKHFSTLGYISVWACTFFIEPFSRFFLLLCTLRFKEIKAMVKGYRLLISSLPIP
ncbi:MAG: glycosyltransferase family 2 protein [Ferruginibacter sp.]